MKIIFDVIILLVGFVALIKGADWFVDGAAALAKKLKVPGLIIGLTVVAMGTSAPELAVCTSSVTAAASPIPCPTPPPAVCMWPVRLRNNPKIDKCV